MNGPSMASLLEFAVDIAAQAGRVTLQHFGAEVHVDRKADLSPVTIADRAAEQLLRAAVERRFPEDGIVGEEFGVTRPHARRLWFFDPIDGTRSFVRGVPLYGTMVALVENGQPLLGVIELPALGETVSAALGEGCRRNGATTRVSDVAVLAEALVTSTDVEAMGARNRTAAWDRIRERAGMCRTWGDCYGYFLVAAGRAEAMIDPILNVWDAAAVFPIVEEAGGVVTDLDGVRRYDGGNLIATNAALSGELRSLLREER